MKEYDEINVRIEKCPKCGAKVEPGSRFCEFCGSPLNENPQKPVHKDMQPQKQTQPEQGKKKKSKVPLIIGGIAAAAVIAIGIFVVAGPIITGNEKEIQNTASGEFAGEETEGLYEDQIADTGRTDADNTADNSSENPSEIEEKVLDIRDQYNQIVTNYDNGRYFSCAIRDGVTACWEGNDLVMIIAEKNADYDRNRYLYYADGELIFAYYESEDSYRFYFDDGELMRIRYCEDSSDVMNAVNIDDPSAWGSWPTDLEIHNNAFREEALEAKKYMDLTAGDFILPNSSSSYLSMSDLEGLTKEECRIARNEIFARHGRKFDDETLQAYFNSFEWYTPSIDPKDFTDNMLNDFELKNLDLIIVFEEEKGYR